MSCVGSKYPVQVQEIHQQTSRLYRLMGICRECRDIVTLRDIQRDQHWWRGWSGRPVSHVKRGPEGFAKFRARHLKVKRKAKKK
jgi:hypothetical protein